MVSVHGSHESFLVVVESSLSLEVLGGVFGPDLYVLFFEDFGVSVSPEEEEQFFDNASEEDTAGGDEGELFTEIKGKRFGEKRASCTVSSFSKGALSENVLEEHKVLSLLMF